MESELNTVWNDFKEKGVVAFLASYVTRQILYANGGWGEG